MNAIVQRIRKGNRIQFNGHTWRIEGFNFDLRCYLLVRNQGFKVIRTQVSQETIEQACTFFTLFDTLSEMPMLNLTYHDLRERLSDLLFIEIKDIPTQYSQLKKLAEENGFEITIEVKEE